MFVTPKYPHKTPHLAIWCGGNITGHRHIIMPSHQPSGTGLQGVFRGYRYYNAACKVSHHWAFISKQFVYSNMAPIKLIEYFRVKPPWLFVKITDEDGKFGGGEGTL